jgi:hypothetical protein
MTKKLSEVLDELPYVRQLAIENRMIEIMNGDSDRNSLYNQVRRNGEILCTKRFIHNENYYRIDDIHYQGIVYVVEMKNGELMRITK